MKVFLFIFFRNCSLLELGDLISFLVQPEKFMMQYIWWRKTYGFSYFIYFLSHIYIYRMVYRFSGIYIVAAWYSLILYQILTKWIILLLCPWFFPSRVFHVNMCVFLFFLLSSCFSITNWYQSKVWLERGLIFSTMAMMKCDILLLDFNTRFSLW